VDGIIQRRCWKSYIKKKEREIGRNECRKGKKIKVLLSEQ
jgi:hypothetical protein